MWLFNEAISFRLVLLAVIMKLHERNLLVLDKPFKHAKPCKYCLSRYKRPSFRAVYRLDYNLTVVRSNHLLNNVFE